MLAHFTYLGQKRISIKSVANEALSPVTERQPKCSFCRDGLKQPSSSKAFEVLSV